MKSNSFQYIGGGRISRGELSRGDIQVVFLLCSKRFFARYSSFPLSSKTNISKFQFDQESGRRRTTLWMCYLQIIIIYLLLLLLLLLDLLPILCKNVFWYAMLESKSLTGKRQTRSSYNLKYCNLLWFSPPNMSLVLQRGSFVPCE